MRGAAGTCTRAAGHPADERAHEQAPPRVVLGVTQHRSSATQVRRAVVTGGAGFVGSWLCSRLLDADVEVVCVDNLVTGSRDNVAGLVARPGFTP